MPDMVLQHVDSLLVERIRSLARDRQCSINEIMLYALRSGLGISAAQQFSESLRDPEALTVLEGQWEAAEQGVFQEALRALAQTRPTQLAPESIGYAGRTVGAE
ncbi:MULTISPECIES: hypothetical protein [Rhodanobacter]|uniref:hypothetical protein n=1 Tax=Rhodanobacter TaxID=75309 RepID=UPI000260FB63|nr:MULTISPECIES: hypothetical protein [Rhodanobacter]EIL98700.1 hypothetical protein UUC_16855 [Rhodanobacter denitrificans]KZC20938.1 hypothetical protein RHOFW104R3_22830 [Rhodanobacter denitrificans]UJJ51007.1 hypothetical protein LRK52_17520 [Rhodanobacter denitrificans]UJJ60200.1 hypothetical protein LRK55_08735 [Rhodanobacter denitrificans]UJM90207.1 hypothetical protein LRK24_17555 [Rhodanobacter denitrificans]